MRISLASVVLCAGVAFGHHSFAGFDMAKNITLTGTVREFQWVNPHSWIQMVVVDSSGKEVEWSIEMSAPASLARQGWKPRTLKPGDKITVVTHPLRDGRAGGSFVAITLPDGTKMGGSPTTSSQEEAPR